ncbi:MAG: hypothetical protein QM831_06930 [Kofleriaceae bacterium]
MGKQIVWLCAVVLGACVDSSSVQCGFGLCPEGFGCDEADKLCIAPGCGDGVQATNEQCDGTINAAVDCTSYGYYSTTGLACTAACTVDTSGCVGRCGDHEINGPETCDGVPPEDRTCGDYGFQIGHVACSQTECAPSFDACDTIGWHRGIGVAPNDLRGIWGSSQTDMWAVGLGGAIMHGDGAHWVPFTSPVTVDLTGIWGAAANDIWAVGFQGTIIHFDGTSWSTIASPVASTIALRGISGHLVNGHYQVWAVGGMGTIVTSVDGGTWTAETSGVTNLLVGIDAHDAFVIVGGYAASVTGGTSTPIALRRELASATWTPIINIPAITLDPSVQNPDPAVLAGVYVHSPYFMLTGTASYVFGSGQTTVLFGSGTSNTKTTYLPTSGDGLAIFGFETSDSAHPDIYIGGTLGTIVRYDLSQQASHFEPMHLGNTTLGITGLWGTGPDFLRASMFAGEVFEYDGTDFATETVGETSQRWLSVWASGNTGNAFAVGTNNMIARRSGGKWGVPYTLPANPTGNDITTWTAIYGFGATPFTTSTPGTDTIFVAGTGGGIYWVNNGDAANAANWTLSTGIGANKLYIWQGLWGISASDMWACGANGHIARWNGTTWTLETPQTLPMINLNAIWGTGDNDVYVVGNMGLFYHWDGSTWTQIPTGFTLAFDGVWGSATNDVYLTSGTGVIYHYDGMKVARVSSGVTNDFATVGGTSAADVFFGGRSALLHASHGGQLQPINFGITDTFGEWITPSVSYFAGSGQIARLGRTRTATETRCSDPWDNDDNGKAGCEDAACATDPSCVEGGLCAPAKPLQCGDTLATSSYSGITRMDDYPCLDHADPGPEATFRFVAETDASVAISIDDPSGKLDLVALDPYDATRSACDPSHCTAASGGAITFDAHAGQIYYFVVDGPQYTASDFGLHVDCQ